MKIANDKDGFYTDNTMSMTIKFPKMLLDRISNRKAERITMNLNPHLLVIWSGYYTYFIEIIRMYEAYGNMAKMEVPVKFLDLIIEWTDVPETVEVY